MARHSDAWKMVKEADEAAEKEEEDDEGEGSVSLTESKR
jgi:hypothetical protein